MTGPIDRTVTTDADGYYIRAPRRRHVRGLGRRATAMRVADGHREIAAGATTTLDFALDPLPSTVVTGTVTDGSGHGWPLYARIDIDGYPGGPVFTDPMTGAVQRRAGERRLLHIQRLRGRSLATRSRAVR